MKIINKIIGLVLIVSCSKNESNEVNYLYGKWKLEAQFKEDGTNKNIDECSKKTNVTFNENNTFLHVGYSVKNGICISDNNSNIISFNISGDRMLFNDKQLKLNFINENKMETIEVLDERNGQSGEWFTNKDVWIRVK
ncbi:lipocalin family protein [Tenacibaculum sp. TC6]|uniref:lipocalin family protein n=1 Tax=Tenacibaculum sp. TC6 TaxID=3423223 RepID=UPI003D366D13